MISIYDTGSYLFPSGVSPSGNIILDSILAEIPYFAIGVLGFGIFTFFLALKRANLVIVFIFTSSLLAFIAAILDLIQVFYRARRSEPPTSFEAVAPVLIIRELAVAFSIGFRFLCLWCLVFVRLRDLRSQQSFRDSRWSVVLRAMSWMLMVAIVTLVILQLSWRTVRELNAYGPVYVVENAFEILTSVLFIIMLLSVAHVSSSASKKRALVSWIAPISALLLSVLTAVGNLKLFAFSESTPGRFLQAAMIYIFTLFILISAFKVPSSDSDSAASSKSTDEPDEKQQKRMEITVVQRGSPDFTLISESLHFSQLSKSSQRPSRASEWLFANSKPQDGDELDLWSDSEQASVDIPGPPTPTKSLRMPIEDTDNQATLQQPPSPSKKDRHISATTTYSLMSYYTSDQLQLDDAPPVPDLPPPAPEMKESNDEGRRTALEPSPSTKRRERKRRIIKSLEEVLSLQDEVDAILPADSQEGVSIVPQVQAGIDATIASIRTTPLTVEGKLASVTEPVHRSFSNSSARWAPKAVSTAAKSEATSPTHASGSDESKPKTDTPSPNAKPSNTPFTKHKPAPLRPSGRFTALRGPTLPRGPRSPPPTAPLPTVPGKVRLADHGRAFKSTSIYEETRPHIAARLARVGGARQVPVNMLLLSDDELHDAFENPRPAPHVSRIGLDMPSDRTK